MGCAPLAQAQLNLETLLSVPFPTELTAAPSGGAVAWVQNHQGRRNVWVARPPAYTPEPVTRYQADDGQEISALTFAPDGKALVFVRGGAANRQGETPNPAQLTNGAEQALYYLPLEPSGAEPQRIGLGSQPALAPTGRHLAFVRGGQVYGLELPTDPAAKLPEPAQWFKSRGTAGALRWRPDGSQLAFTSSRGTHRLLGVYDLASKAYRFLAPSLDSDSQPVWSPDGRQLAFLRQPPQPDYDMWFTANPADLPWAIWTVDVASGQAKPVFKADDGLGSAFWEISAKNQLFWTASGHLVFPWEKTGWLLLYSVPATGGPAKLLTPGQFEVEYATLAPDGQHVVFNSNQNDTDRRHIWRVDGSGARAPEALTSGDGIEWAPALPDAQTLFCFRSGARTPAHVARLAAPGQAPRPLFTEPVAPMFNQLVVPQAVTFTAADGLKIPAQLFLPPNAPAGKRPAVIFFHGGSRRQMLLGYNYGFYYHNAYAFNQYLASRGYVVLSVNFRSGIGYGQAFREAPNFGAGGASEFNDVLGAGLYLQNRPEVDPAKIGLWGGSYGGYLTALGLARASHLFACGVDVHGVHNWNGDIKAFEPSYDSLRYPRQAELAFRSSPLAHVDGWRSPVLLIHGDDDRNVLFSESVTLAAALRARRVEVETLVLPDEVHSFLRYQSWLAVFERASQYLDQKLKH
jgi:dipeptidyl aminopeptidase/acylaminoacyl peptidase